MSRRRTSGVSRFVVLVVLLLVVFVIIQRQHTRSGRPVAVTPREMLRRE
jgi:hypothetical protein